MPLDDTYVLKDKFKLKTYMIHLEIYLYFSNPFHTKESNDIFRRGYFISLNAAVKSTLRVSFWGKNLD